MEFALIGTAAQRIGQRLACVLVGRRDRGHRRAVLGAGYRCRSAATVKGDGGGVVGIIILNSPDALAAADRGAVGRVRQVNIEGLVRLNLGVAVDRNRDGLGVLAG